MSTRGAPRPATTFAPPAPGTACSSGDSPAARSASTMYARAAAPSALPASRPAHGSLHSASTCARSRRSLAWYPRAMDQSTVSQLLDRQEVLDVVNRVFLATDARRWDELLALFDERVRFDMSSLSGQPEAELPAQEIVDGWRTGLAGIAAVHHQTGNFVVTLAGDRADVFCYGIALHHRPEAEKRVTMFVGSYVFALARAAGTW